MLTALRFFIRHGRQEPKAKAKGKAQAGAAGAGSAVAMSRCTTNEPIDLISDLVILSFTVLQVNKAFTIFCQ